MKRLIIILSCIWATTGCVSFSMEEVLLERDGISLSWKGELQVSYDPDSFQLGFNDGRNEYRVYNDRLADWFVVRCSEKPVHMDQTLSADVTWTGKKGQMSVTGIQFKVEKTDENGLVWLWNDSDRIGIIIKNII